MAKILKAIGNALGISSKVADATQAASGKARPDIAKGAPHCAVPMSESGRPSKGRSCCSGG